MEEHTCFNELLRFSRHRKKVGIYNLQGHVLKYTRIVVQPSPQYTLRTLLLLPIKRHSSEVSILSSLS